jgi:coenzyme F420 hydrogenase subunit beta
MQALEEICDAVILTATDGSIPVPRIVETPQDVLACSGSKFTAAPTIAGLNEAINKGYQRIGVVTTPCQSLAVAQMKAHFSRNNIDDPIHLIVGLFCMWAFDYRSFRAYIDAYCDSNTILKMNVPPPPRQVLEIVTEEGVQEIPLDALRPCMLPACMSCHDLTAEFSDISVGLYEGIPGWNTVITRTKRGESLVHHAVNNGLLEMSPFPQSRLNHLQSAALQKKRKGFLQLEGKGLLNGPHRTSIRIDETTLDVLLEERQ